MATASASIVICGAGMAGIAAAFHLAVKRGYSNVVIVEESSPLSLTSDKSTEAYRNWWPGPDRAMTAFMNRSIDLIEEIAHATHNRINMNRRGYLFATAEASKVDRLCELALAAQAHGSGPVRMHDTASSRYAPSPQADFDAALTGADIITDRGLIRHHFPYLAHNTRAVVHARRAGWMSAQQLGMVMLEAARAHGARLIKAKVVGIDTRGGRVRAVHVAQEGKGRALEATHVVLAAGPMLKPVARLIGVELPLVAERHLKISLPDPLRAVPRTAPMSIWLDEQFLPWSEDERAALADDEDASWLLQKFPSGVHGRPEGGGASTTLLVLFNYDTSPTDVIFPLPEEANYAEIALRGMSTMVPALGAYVQRGTRPHVDGGYYIKTRENRPLVGPLPLEGAYVSGAYSGFGVMAACAGGELLAQHVMEGPLPDYAPAFLLSRYRDDQYCRLLEAWGDGGQL
jgi:glycine/D-amino acid oxidase-like deaminating enzyme